MGNIDHVLSAFYSTPLAILPEKALEIASLLRDRAHGSPRPTDAGEAYRAKFDALCAAVQAIDPQAVRRTDNVVMSGRTAVLPVFGVLSQRVSALERSSGGISTEEVGAVLESLVSDQQVKSVVMVYDSPGGSVFGVKELGDRIRSMREEKKIVAHADPMAASAAYWLAAQASEVSVSPSGQVGSVGVISAHEDISGLQEKMGVKTSLITSSPFKAETSPFGPLSDEARAELQSKVNSYHGQFIEALAKGRGITEHRVENGFGQGRMMLAEQAKAAGMVDRISTFSDLLRRLGAGSAGARAENPIDKILADAVAADKVPEKRLAAKLAAVRARAVEITT